MTPQDQGVAVTYTGREDPFVERNYGSALQFVTGQTRIVPVELAVRLLRHADVFEPAKAVNEEGSTSDADKPAATGQSDDTATQIAAAAAKATEQASLDNQRQDAVDQINIMDKDALKDYAHVKYGQPLPKTLSVENMRAKVVGLIDQFGLV